MTRDAWLLLVWVDGKVEARGLYAAEEVATIAIRNALRGKRVGFYDDCVAITIDTHSIWVFSRKKEVP